nr:Protein PLASTID MOVEMENT IMPAIRED 1-RELATED like [Ipomoea batatas]
MPGEDDPRAAAVRFGFGFDTSGEDFNSRLRLLWMTLQWRRALATLFLCIASRPSPPDHRRFRHRLTSSVSCFRNEEFCSGESNLEVIEEVLQEEQRKSEIDKSSVGKRDWISLLAEKMECALLTCLLGLIYDPRIGKLESTILFSSLALKLSITFMS